MSETEDPATRPSAIGALLQVGAAAGIGALLLPFGFGYVVVVTWAAGGEGALVVGAVFAVVVLALLVGAASLAPEASHLTGTMGGRVGWALVVAVAGTSAWAIALSMYNEADLVPDFAFSFLPYALVAGLLLRGWYFKACAAAVAVLSAVALFWAARGFE